MSFPLGWPHTAIARGLLTLETTDSTEARIETHWGSVLSAVSVLDDVLSVVSEVRGPEFCLLSEIRKHLVHRNSAALMAKLNKPVPTTQPNHAHIVAFL